MKIENLFPESGLGHNKWHYINMCTCITQEVGINVKSPYNVRTTIIRDITEKALKDEHVGKVHEGAKREA